MLNNYYVKYVTDTYDISIPSANVSLVVHTRTSRYFQAMISLFDSRVSIVKLPLILGYNLSSDGYSLSVCEFHESEIYCVHGSSATFLCHENRSEVDGAPLRLMTGARGN